MPAIASYPHQHQTYRPLALSADNVARLALALRTQLCGFPGRPKVELDSLFRRSRHLVINGVDLDLHVDVCPNLFDDRGVTALGSTHHDGTRVPRIVISLNGSQLDGDEALARSTVMHELGHAVLDAPSWVVAAQHAATVVRQSHYLRRSTRDERSSPRTWPEWRANAFMGAFLCPQSLLHQWMVKRAAALGVSLIESGRPSSLPLVSSARTDPDRLDALIFDLSEVFGLSTRFIEIRLHKYRLIKGH